MTLTDLFKNEYTKQALRLTGVHRAPFTTLARTAHYRCPLVEVGQGLVTLRRYDGPQIPATEWESMEYTTYCGSSSGVARNSLAIIPMVMSPGWMVSVGTSAAMGLILTKGGSAGSAQTTCRLFPNHRLILSM